MISKKKTYKNNKIIKNRKKKQHISKYNTREISGYIIIIIISRKKNQMTTMKKPAADLNLFGDNFCRAKKQEEFWLDFWKQSEKEKHSVRNL